MRSVTYLLTPDEGHFDTMGPAFLAHGVTREAIHGIRTLGDGSVVVQMKVGENPSRVRDICEDSTGDGLRSYHVVSNAEGALVQLHFEPTGVLADLIAIHEQHPVVPEFPIEFVDSDAGSVRVVEAGCVTELRRVVTKMREVSSVTIEEVGGYDPESDRLYAGLTERQQQVLRTALERGYYDVPRDVTYEDIARDLDCSASTVGQHLRRIEATVLSDIAPTSHRATVKRSAVR